MNLCSEDHEEVCPRRDSPKLGAWSEYEVVKKQKNNMDTDTIKAETTASGMLICIMQGDAWIIIDRDAALKLLELLPSLISQMPVKITQ